MKTLLPFLMVLGLTGCAWDSSFHRVEPPEVTTQISDQQVSTHIALHRDSYVRALSTPRIEHQNDFGGWQRVWSQTFTIPGNNWGTNVRVVPGGRVNSIQYSYDGSEWRSVPPGSWQFGIPNYKDGGSRLLKIQIFYQPVGGKPEPVETDIYVENGLGS